jgi:PAS domain S-box-containing protein
VHEHRLRRADGEYRWFQLRAVRSQGRCDGIPRWYVLETDIHDRKMAEEALQRNETRLREVQHLSRTGAWRYDVAAGTVESSAEIQRVYGVQPGEDISQPPFWFDRIHPEDRPRVQAQFEQCMREKTDYRAGYRIVLPDGSIRYQYATGHPVTNDDGELLEFVGASMDMTEHWLATTELERTSEAVRDLQSRMSRAAHIATVGELAGSIAHEVNQPLAAVVANGHACLRWLSASPPNVPKAVEAVERIVNDGKAAGEVVRRVRALFKRTAVEKVPLDLSEVIQEVLRLLDSYPSRKHVSLDTVSDPELPPVVADRVQLQQLLLNLMLNALEALEPVSGRVKQLAIRSKRKIRQAVIQISDNGIGLDDPVGAFEPFVTTKPEGMGLGLAICRSIVAAHDGTLSAERNAGFGMTFTVSLPIHADIES